MRKKKCFFEFFNVVGYTHEIVVCSVFSDYNIVSRQVGLNQPASEELANRRIVAAINSVHYSSGYIISQYPGLKLVIPDRNNCEYRFIHKESESTSIIVDVHLIKIESITPSLTVGPKCGLTATGP